MYTHMYVYVCDYMYKKMYVVYMSHVCGTCVPHIIHSVHIHVYMCTHVYVVHNIFCMMYRYVMYV